MKLRIWGVNFTATLFLLTFNAKAATLLDQPLDPSLPGAFSNFTLALTNQHIADDFLLTAETTLESISWSGYYETPQTIADPVSFKLRFYGDDGDTPGLPVNPFFQEYDVNVNATATGDIGENPPGAPASGPVFSYTFSLPSLTLDAGTYWLSILEADTRTPGFSPSQWLWSRSDLIFGGLASQSGDLDSWSRGGSGNMALTLTGTVIPIPATIWLFGSGLLGLIGIARRKQTAYL